MSPRMGDGRGRFPRGLLVNAPAPRTLDEAMLARGGEIDGATWTPGVTFSGGASRLEFDGTLSPSQADMVREMMVDGYGPAEIMATVQPIPPPRWRWHKDAAVWGLIAGSAVIALLLIVFGGS